MVTTEAIKIRRRGTIRLSHTNPANENENEKDHDEEKAMEMKKMIFGRNREGGGNQLHHREGKTLIPRPDSESVVEAAVRVLLNDNNRRKGNTAGIIIYRYTDSYFPS